MSAVDCESANPEPDGDSDGSFRNEDNGFGQGGQFEEDEHFPNEDPGKQIEHQVESPIRHVRPMRPQNAPMQYRPGPGPRPPFPPGFRGHPRMPMQMGGNSRLPYMRPGMGPRGGPPFDNYGPPPMGMPRGCPPPRYPQQPRYPPMSDNQTDEDMEDQQQSCGEMSGHEFDGPPNSNSFQGPGMRLRGPPPFMMGPNGGSHPSGPPGIPHGPPRSGPVPPGGPPFNGPPGQNFNGPQFNGPPMSSSGGPPYPGPPQQNMSGPNSGPPFSGPHSGPPFSGPFSGPPGPNMGPPNFSGPPPGSGFTGHPPGPEYPGQPPSNFSSQPSGPPFSGPPGPNYSGSNRPPFGPPFNVPPGTPGSSQPGPPPAAHSSLPPGVPPPVPPANCPPMGGPPPGASPGVMPPNAPPGPPFAGPPGHPSSQAPAVQPPPSFSDSMHALPPGAPTATPFGSGPPRPPFPPGAPIGVPSSSATSLPNMVSPTGTSSTTTPAMCPPPVPQPTPTTVASPFGYPPGPVATSESSQYTVPPGFPGMPPTRPMTMPPGIPPQSLCSAPPGFPLHLMPPPPMSNLTVMPPGLPPFRSGLPFVPPAMPIGHLTPKAPSTTQVKVGEDIWVENLTAEGKSYYYNMRTRETRWDRPEGVTLVKQDEVEHPAKATPAVTAGTNASTTPAAAQRPPDVAVWTEYHNPEGKAYYHNTKTGETTWEKPKALADWEASLTASRTPVSESNQTTPAMSTQGSNVIDPKQETTSAEGKKTDASETTSEKTDTPAKSEENLTSSATESKEETTKAPKDNSRPVSSTAVPGTPWCVVWTGDDRAFFFNPSQRLSVWEKPEELKGRADVDRLLEKRPNATATPNAVAEDESKPTSGDDDADDGSSAAKKPRLETDDDVEEDSEMRKNGPEEDVPEGEKIGGAPDKIPVGMEAAKEAEERAARERAVQPLEVRVKRFREMLVEMQVSAFSTWEKELHKIVFDPRYLLLTSKERRQTFEAYVKERAEEERREKKNKLKEKKEKFVELLEEAGLNSKSSFGDFSTKYQKDERFKAIDKARDRESMFQDFLSELRKREKDEKHREKEKTRTDFMNLLKEQKSLTKHSHWSDVKRKIHSDPRYKAVDSSSRREDWFREYVKKLDETPSREDSGARKEREKRERQEASLREREKEVKEALSSSMREREKERDQQLHNEQETNFRTMLLDLVRDPNMTWKEAKKALRKDSRWEFVGDVLPRSERDEIFKEHMASLAKKMRDFPQKSSSDSGREKRNSTSETAADDQNSIADENDVADRKDSLRR